MTDGSINYDIKATAKTADATRQAAGDMEDLANKVNRANDSIAAGAERSRGSVGSMARDLMQGDFSRVPDLMMDIASSGGTLARALGGVAVVGAVVAKAYADGSRELDAFRKAMIMTGDATGTTESQLESSAVTGARAVHSTVAEMADALTQLVTTSKVGADNLLLVSEAAVRLERDAGVAVSATVKEFAALGESPVQASAKLNEQYHYLTAAVFDQIKALEDEGKTVDAAALAQKTYADAIMGRTAELESNLGQLERAWRNVKDMAKGAWDAMLNVGRTQSMDAQLADLKKQLATGGWDSGLSEDDIKAQITTLEALIKKDKEAGLARGADAAGVSAHIKDALDTKKDRVGSPRAAAVPEWQRFMDRLGNDEAGAAQGLTGESVKNIGLLNEAFLRTNMTLEEFERHRQRIIDNDSKVKEAIRLGAAGDEAKASVARLNEEWQRQEESATRAMQIMPAAARKLADALAKVDKESAAERDKLGKAFARGQISQEDYQSALEELTARTDDHKAAVWALAEQQNELNASWEYGARSAMQTYLDEMQNVAAQSNRLVSGMLKQEEDMFVKWATTGKLQASDLFGFIAQEMARTLYRQQFSPIVSAGTSWLSNIFGDFFGSGSGSGAGGGSSFSGLEFAANGNVFSSPDLARYENTVVSRPTLFKFANGGALGVAGEAGSEAIMPLTRGANGKLGVQASGMGGVVVEVYDQRTAPTASAVDVQQGTGSDGMQQIRVFIRDEVKSQLNSGALDSTMRANFGSGRAVTRR